MHRSSESIGTIAGALAKAQAELANPEKSLTANHPVAVSPRGRPGRSAMPYCPQGAGQSRKIANRLQETNRRSNGD
jgi:hypothetical protein